MRILYDLGVAVGTKKKRKHTQTYIHKYIYTHTYTHIHTHVHKYVYTHIYIYMYCNITTPSRVVDRYQECLQELSTGLTNHYELFRVLRPRSHAASEFTQEINHLKNSPQLAHLTVKFLRAAYEKKKMHL